jgi:hypothetical protein
MSKRKSPTRVSKVPPRRTSKAPGITPVEAAWRKFVDKFQAFQKMPSDEDNEKEYKAWEEALSITTRAAYNVMESRATCLHDMEVKIRAWAFIAEVPKDGTLDGLTNWQPRRLYMGADSTFIASLRDDVLAMKRLVSTAKVAVASIACQHPLVLNDGAQHEQRRQLPQ